MGRAPSELSGRAKPLSRRSLTVSCSDAIAGGPGRRQAGTLMCRPLANTPNLEFRQTVMAQVFQGRSNSAIVNEKLQYFVQKNVMGSIFHLSLDASIMG